MPEQVTLAGNLPYTLPVGLAPDSVHLVEFTQDATGGHTVTFAGQPVAVDLAAEASSTVEFHPVAGGYAVRNWPTPADPQAIADAVADYLTANPPAGGGAASSAVVTVPNIGWTDSITLAVAGLTGPHVVAPVTAEGAQAWAAGQWWASSPADGQLTITGTIQPSADPVDVRVVWWE